MNRVEFMSQLAVLLEDISAEERKEALQYYHDYFDDAGQENEQDVINELGGPQKVARTIKAGLNEREESYQPGEKNEIKTWEEEHKTKNRTQTNPVLKVLMIILIVIVGGPVLLPLGTALIATMVGLFVALISILFVFLIVAIVLMVIGAVLFAAGIGQLFTALAVGLAMLGTGIITFILGLMIAAGLVHCCIKAIPGVIRWAIVLIRKPLHRKAAV